LPQPCEADLTIWGDFEAAATTDSLDKAIDYTRLLELVFATADAREYNLLESLAYRIAREILQAFPAQRVGVRVRKRPASLVDKVDHIEVEMFES
jgi:dihydroneopterin aldolase